MNSIRTVGAEHTASSFDTSRAWDYGYDQSDVQDNFRVFDLPCLSHRAFSLTGYNGKSIEQLKETNRETNLRHSAHAISPLVRCFSLLLIAAQRTYEIPTSCSSSSVLNGTVGQGDSY